MHVCVCVCVCVCVLCVRMVCVTLAVGAVVSERAVAIFAAAARPGLKINTVGILNTALAMALSTEVMACVCVCVWEGGFLSVFISVFISVSKVVPCSTP